MKTLKIIALVGIFTLISADSFGYNIFRGTRNHNHWSNTQPHNTPPAVGAPLDGGLLAILGAAGVAYYAARRRKKNSVNP